MKLQVFIHGIDVVEDILHYSGDDTHCVCVMEIPLHAHRNDDDKCRCTSLNSKHRYKDVILTSMVCVFPDDVCPYAKIVPLYPSRTSAEHHKQLVIVKI